MHDAEADGSDAGHFWRCTTDGSHAFVKFRSRHVLLPGEFRSVPPGVCQQQWWQCARLGAPNIWRTGIRCSVDGEPADLSSMDERRAFTRMEPQPPGELAWAA